MEDINKNVKITGRTVLDIIKSEIKNKKNIDKILKK